MAAKLAAVTFGDGRDAERAKRTAESFEKHTSLKMSILGGDAHPTNAASQTRLLRYRFLELVDADEVLVLEPGMLCLRSWDPHDLQGRTGIVCVRDNASQGALDDCREWDLNVEDYFHPGFLVINRQRHAEWLRLAESIAAWRRHLRRNEQTALNIARAILRTPLSFVDRRFNWRGYGNGSLCHRLPIIVAPGTAASSDVLVQPGCDPEERFINASINSQIWDPVLQERVGGRFYSRRWMGRPAGRLFLRKDGAIVPEGADGERNWFAYETEAAITLAFATDQELVRSFTLRANDVWDACGNAVSEQMKALPSHDSPDFDAAQTPEELEVAARIIQQYAFQYIRVGYDQRRMELLDGGEIGAGRGGCENRWGVARSDGKMELILSGSEGIICRLTEDGSNGWWGRWLKHERMPIEMKPISPSAALRDDDNLGIRNEHEFRVIAMRRSGHHALMRWLAGHFREGAHHCNDVPPFADPFTNHRGYFRLFEDPQAGAATPINFERIRNERKACLLINWEDMDLTWLADRPLLPNSERFVGRSRCIRHILCLRDPYNMLASLYAMERNTVLRHYADVLKRWKLHALEFLGETVFLKEKVLVNHNTWSVSREYREALSAEFKLDFNDRGFQILPYSSLGGSSFERALDKEKRPEAMGLQERWRYFEHDFYFRQFFEAVPDLRDITSRIFGPVGPDW